MSDKGDSKEDLARAGLSKVFSGNPLIAVLNAVGVPVWVIIGAIFGAALIIYGLQTWLGAQMTKGVWTMAFLGAGSILIAARAGYARFRARKLTGKCDES